MKQIIFKLSLKKGLKTLKTRILFITCLNYLFFSSYQWHHYKMHNINWKRIHGLAESYLKFAGGGCIKPLHNVMLEM